MIEALAILFTLAGAFVYRMRGGMPPSFPSPIDQIIFALPYAIFTYFYLAPQPVSIYELWGTVAFALIITTVMVRKGHGNSMDLGHSDGTPEWYEFVIRPLYGRVPLYWYDFLGLCVSGLTYTVPVGVITMNPVIAFSGLLKAPAYALSWKADAHTEGGELLTGALLWGTLAMVVLTLVG